MIEGDSFSIRIQDELGEHTLDSKRDCIFICDHCKNEVEVNNNHINKNSEMQNPTCDCGNTMRFSYWLDNVYNEEEYKELSQKEIV